MSTTSTTSTIPLLIPAHPTPNTTFPVISPQTNTTIYNAASASPKDALSAVSAAAAAFPAWRATNATKRRDILLKACAVMEARATELAKYTQDEIGADPQFAAGTVHGGIQTMKDVASRISSVCVGSMPATADDGQSGVIFREPYGVILGILPWNAPYSMATQCIAPALATGNTVVLKSSELSPKSYWGFADCLREAGLPEGVLSVIQVKPEDAAEVTKVLIEAKDVKKVTFTGSANVGSIIAAQCGKALKPCVMELGGKASAIVLEDADLGKAALQCAIGSFVHSGQICMSTTRILVHKSVAEPFAQAFKATTDQIFGQTPSMCMVNGGGATKAKSLVQDAVDKGARLVYGDLKAKVESETQLKPMIIEGLTPEMKLYNEESFGPEVAIFAVESEEDAARIANDSDFGLAAAIFTEDLKRALRVSRMIESGNVCINSATMHDEANFPRGGVKRSGFGRVNGNDGLEEFLWSKTVVWQND